MDSDSPDKTIDDTENAPVDETKVDDPTIDVTAESSDTTTATDTDTDYDASTEVPALDIGAETVVPDVEAEPDTSVTLGMTNNVEADKLADTTDTKDNEDKENPSLVGNMVLAKPSKPKRKWLLVTVIAIIVVIVGGGAGAYAFWYQDPNKVVADAAMSLFSSNPTTTNTVITSSSELASDMPVSITLKKITLDTKSHDSKSGSFNASVVISMAGRDYTLNADVISTANGDLYYKIDNVSNTLERFMPGVLKSNPDLAATVDKLENTWVKGSLGDLDDRDKALTCTIDTVRKYTGDDKVKTQLKDAYKAHPFITVKDKVGAEDGSLGYHVELDESKAQQFATAVENTDFARELKKCNTEDSTSKISPDVDKAIQNSNDTRVEATIWVSRWTHQLTAIDYNVSMKDDSGNTMKFNGRTNVGYDKVNNVSAPKDSVSFEQWSKNLQDLLPALLFGSSSSSENLDLSKLSE